MLALATVHATGVNWDSVSAICAIITVALFAFTGVIRFAIKQVGNQVSTAVDKVSSSNKEILDRLDKRIAILEALAEIYHGYHPAKDNND